MKRKRANAIERAAKRARQDDASPGQNRVDHHPVLSQYYAEILPLRQYLLLRVPPSSKTRRRSIANFGLSDDGRHADLARTLDTVLIGCNRSPSDGEVESRAEEFENFSQSSTLSSAGSTGPLLHSEIVDFVIWLLFKRHPSLPRPPHLLCHGFQRAAPGGYYGLDASIAPGIPGLIAHYPNKNVETLKAAPWCGIPSLVGNGFESLMFELLLDCGIFVPTEARPNSFYQLSGLPLSELKPLSTADAKTVREGPNPGRNGHQPPHESISNAEHINKPSAVKFVRSRMFYARAALNAKGSVRFGMRHIHVFNRYTDCQNQEQTVHVMKYIFPRQFGLHNVFTSTVDKRETSHAFKDYTLREHEIARLRLESKPKPDRGDSQSQDSRLPKRLRGKVVQLIGQLRRRHQKCAYVELLRHYCSVPATSEALESCQSCKLSSPEDENIEKSQAGSQPAVSQKESGQLRKPCQHMSLLDMATPAAHVSVFCRAVVSRVFPDELWGEHDVGRRNKHILLHQVDKFVQMRRFESPTLHNVLQDIKVAGITWLEPPNIAGNGKMAASDTSKRLEILAELLYYVFDSFLIPLIRSNFHVTESSTHKNRLFYFRHDVWRMFTEPAIAELKASMFEEMKSEKALKLLSSRPIGYSQIRLLPKTTGFRPITNLRRRIPTLRSGKTVLGRSINAVMTPAFDVLKFEKSSHSDKLGSSLFSVGDILSKLRTFRSALGLRGESNVPLYFAKVDIKSCFDTIPQRRLVDMVNSLLSHRRYVVGKYAEVGPPARHQYHTNSALAKPSTKFCSHGQPLAEAASSSKPAIVDKAGKPCSVLVNTAAHHVENKEALLNLMEQHIARNIVKVGKKFFRQKEGIPQGSILSTLLCSFFYADFEQRHLRFTSGADCLLMRLVDDFLLITTDRHCAERFLQVMHEGNIDYGVAVRPEKSLANFDASLNSVPIPQLTEDLGFPYCGMRIDTQTLEVTKDTERKATERPLDSLTVDYARLPGATFHRKMLNALKIQLHGLLVDTSFNSVATVLANLYSTFLDSAKRSAAYVKCLPSSKQPSSKLLIKIVEDLVALAAVLLRKRRGQKSVQLGSQKNRTGAISNGRFAHGVCKTQVHWLACRAFLETFHRKQTKHHSLLAWLTTRLTCSQPRGKAARKLLERAIRG